MLGKLMKYDLRYGLRKFWPVWAGIAALSILNGFTIRGVLIDGSHANGLVTFVAGILPIILLGVLGVTLGILMLVFICERFYRGLLGDEGYLMFTLPATSAELIASKALTALILMVLSALVGMVSGTALVALLGGSEFIEALKSIPELLREVELPRGLGWVLAEFLVLVLVGTLTSCLHIYQAVALGHLAKKHRGAWAVVAYIGIDILLSIVLNAIGHMRFPWQLLDRFEFYFENGVLHSSVGAIQAALAGIGIALLWQLVLGVIFFFGTKVVLDRKLNLE
ncbi:MAG: hypothetical protein IJT62_05950 [Oscillospiraceae bacterium]|nr:hypothetical protein [Oscillospiraceae bacterium]